jgi:hypothetical protein
MRGSGESIFWALAFELAPAAIFGSAVAFASATAMAVPRLDVFPLSAGIGAFMGSWLVLRKFGAGAQPLPLADFDQTELERELANLAEEMQLAEVLADGPTEDPDLDELVLEDELPARVDDELILEDRLPAPEEDSRVIRLFDPRTETAGDMQARIDRHLRNTPRPPLSDATQELHEALAALRSSLR